MTWVAGVVRDHRVALEHACLMAGFRLADALSGQHPLRDVYVVARCAPTGSPLAVALSPEYAAWGPIENLLAILVDQLRGLAWGLGGGEGSEPEPIERPWGQPGKDMKRLVGKVMSQAKVAERLNRRMARQVTGEIEAPQDI